MQRRKLNVAKQNAPKGAIGSDCFLLRVGLSVAYRVMVSRLPLVDQKGQELDAVRFADKRKILLAPDLPVSRRLLTLRHEFWHAWLDCHPAPTDEESQAQAFAFAGQEFDFQMRRCGLGKAIRCVKPSAGPLRRRRFSERSDLKPFTVNL